MLACLVKVDQSLVVSISLQVIDAEGYLRRGTRCTTAHGTAHDIAYSIVHISSGTPKVFLDGGRFWCLLINLKYQRMSELAVYTFRV